MIMLQLVLMMKMMMIMMFTSHSPAFPFLLMTALHAGNLPLWQFRLIRRFLASSSEAFRFDYNMVQSYYNQPEMVMAQKSLELSRNCVKLQKVLIEQTRQTSPYSCSKQNPNIIYGEKVHFQDAEGNKLTKLGRCDSV